MRYLLDACYLLLLVVCTPWLLYSAWRRGKYRQGLSEKLLGNVPLRCSQRPCVWFHAVSAGEVSLLKPLLHGIDDKFPGWECVISTTTETGFAMARRRYPSVTTFYCPLDFSWSVQRAMRRVRPQLLVLTELELWPNLIAAAQRSHARIAVVNGRLSDSSFRGYRRAGWLFRMLVQKIDLIAAQNETYGARFRELGALSDRVCVTGSLKFDGVETSRNNPTTRHLAQLAGIGADEVVVLAGSTQAPEESLVLGAYSALSSKMPQLRLILVPRHPDRFEEVATLLDASGAAWQRRTTLESNGGDPKARILLVDTIGELSSWWGTAQIAYVGGSMGSREGQNMIEPAAYAAAVSFGPRTANFRDVVDLLLELDAAVVVRNGTEFSEFLCKCIKDTEWASLLGQRAQGLVREQQGAAEHTLEQLRELVMRDRPDRLHTAA